MTRRAIFGSRLRLLRQEAGFSLKQLGDAINFDPSYISRIENGQRVASPQFAEACERVLPAAGQLLCLADPGPLDLPPVATLIGRAEELARITEWLDPSARTADDSPRICVVRGMGGVGKTALALAAGQEVHSWYPNGSFVLDLRGYRLGASPVTEDEALERMLRRLGVSAKSVPADFDDRAALYREKIANRSMLLVLDSARTIRQVRMLIPPNSASSVIITTRRRLVALDQALRLDLTPLPASAAVELFRTISKLEGLSARRDDPARIERITALCHYIPLAIHIVAGRFRENAVRTLQEIEDSLLNTDSIFAELDDDERSLAATFAESCASLPPGQLRELALISLHPGGQIKPGAAAALLGTVPEQASQSLDRLLRSGMLEPSQGGGYRLHDLFRDYLIQHRPPDVIEADCEAALLRLFDYYLRTTSAADRRIASGRYRIELALLPEPEFLTEFPDVGSAISWMREELDNLVPMARRMFQCRAYVVCWQFVYCLRGYFFAEKPSWNAWIESYRIAINAAHLSSNRWAEAVSTSNLGLALAEHGEWAPAAACYADARELFREIGDEHGVANVSANFAWLDYSRGRFEQAHEQAAEAFAFYQEHGQAANAAIALDCLARCELAMHRPKQAQILLERVLGEFSRLDIGEEHRSQVRALLTEALSLPNNNATTTVPLRPPAAAFESTAHITRVELYMGDKYEIHGPSVGVGRQAHAVGLAYQQGVQMLADGNVVELARQLEALRQALRKQATDRDHDASVAHIAAAATAVEAGNLVEAESRMKQAGRWALEIATATGGGLAAAAIAKALGC